MSPTSGAFNSFQDTPLLCGGVVHYGYNSAKLASSCYPGLDKPAPDLVSGGSSKACFGFKPSRLCRNSIFVIPCKRSATRNPVFSICSGCRLEFIPHLIRGRHDGLDSIFYNYDTAPPPELRKIVFAGLLRDYRICNRVPFRFWN